jgi:nucleotide-binding universal stress UspA family protein
VYQRILVPVDGSKPSKQALEEAINLAKDQHAVTRIVHVIEDPYAFYAADGLSPETIATIEEAGRQAGQQVLEDSAALARQAGLLVEAALVENAGMRTSGAIVDEAKRWRADLIAMGTHGRHGLAHVFLGSVAEGVVRTTPVPVLLVRGQ